MAVIFRVSLGLVELESWKCEVKGSCKCTGPTPFPLYPFMAGLQQPLRAGHGVRDPYFLVTFEGIFFFIFSLPSDCLMFSPFHSCSFSLSSVSCLCCSSISASLFVLLFVTLIPRCLAPSERTQLILLPVLNQNL